MRKALLSGKKNVRVSEDGQYYDVEILLNFEIEVWNDNPTPWLDITSNGNQILILKVFMRGISISIFPLLQMRLITRSRIDYEISVNDEKVIDNFSIGGEVSGDINVNNLTGHITELQLSYHGNDGGWFLRDDLPTFVNEEIGDF